MGGGGGGAPPQHYSLSPGHDHDSRGSPVLFDRKVAQHNSNLSSENNKKGWSKTIRSYLIGERWEMKNLLTLAENWQKNEIPSMRLAISRDP